MFLVTSVIVINYIYVDRALEFAFGLPIGQLLSDFDDFCTIGKLFSKQMKNVTLSEVWEPLYTTVIPLVHPQKLSFNQKFSYFLSILPIIDVSKNVEKMSNKSELEKIFLLTLVQNAKCYCITRQENPECLGEFDGGAKTPSNSGVISFEYREI